MKVFLRVALAAVLCFSIILSAGPPAEAHSNEQSYLVIDVGEELRVRVQMPYADVREVLGVNVAGGAFQIDEILNQNEATLIDYALDHVSLSDEDGEWALTPVAVRRSEAFQHLEIEFSVDHGQDFQTFTATFDPFFDEIDDRDALLLVANDLRRGVIESESDGLVRFTPDNRTNDIDLGNPRHLRNFTESVKIGIDHIRSGMDHVFFVLALLLPSVLIYKGGTWHPAPEAKSTFWRVAKLLTTFTVAHSITLSLAGLGLVPQPNGRIIESAIAISIVATAFHNLRPIWPDREWVIAFGFGLFHGFGFASLVSELEVSTTTQLVSLLGRNIGIELGQLAIIVLMFPMLYALRRLPIYRPIVVIGSMALALVGAIWTLERITEKESSLTGRVEDWLVFPRVAIYIAIASALAFAYVYFRPAQPEQLGQHVS